MNAMAKNSATELERWRVPPVYRLLSSGMLLEGRHTNKVWRGLVHQGSGAGEGVPMIIKWLPKHVAIATELACALAAQALSLDIPAGVIVVADADQLTGIPSRAIPASGEPVICFGSQLQWPDDTAVRPMHDDAAVAEVTWQRLCDTNQGPMGAAWDELVANNDRHYENVLFDGKRWWLFDHERSLEPVASVMKRFTQTQARQQIADHAAAKNILAMEVVRRRPNDHGLDKIPTGLSTKQARLTWIADSVRNWRTGNVQIDGIFQITEVIIRSIDLRLPALALHLERRLKRPEGASLWTSP
jgi:hypothetical protein